MKKIPLILSIDTSCDETSVAITQGRKVLSHKEYSQILLHRKWGGVVPSLAKRAHEERIGWVIDEVLSRLKSSLSMKDIDVIAVTYGPGLAIALEVGIKKAKEMVLDWHKKLIGVNHLEGHIYSAFAQNSKGNPQIKFTFPYLALIVSGGHTELVLFKTHLSYKILGSTLDDAAGEALDKAAKMLGLGYPGGPVIERLSLMADNVDLYKFPRPLAKKDTLNFSFSGLKTSFLYFLKSLSMEEKSRKIKFLASSFQEAVFDSLIIKLRLAIKKTKVRNIVVGGGVISNIHLRTRLRQLAKQELCRILFPPYKYLSSDNASMIGVVAYYKFLRGMFVKDIDKLDRIPRAGLDNLYY